MVFTRKTIGKKGSHTMRKIYSTIPMNALARSQPLNKKSQRNEDYDDGTDEDLGRQRQRQRTPRQRPVDVYDNEQDVWQM